jgi:hypothetical protein
MNRGSDAAMKARASSPGRRRFRLVGVGKHLSLVLIVALAGCGKASDDATLQCRGTAAYIGENDWVKDAQRIALHIKGNQLTFSGNDLFAEKTIAICPTGTASNSADTLYFDSDGCGTNHTLDPRQYGTYNTILRVFELQETMKNGEILSGKFDCKKVE